MRLDTIRIASLAVALAMLVMQGTALAQRRGGTPAVPPEQVAKLLEVLKLGDTAKDVEFLPVLGEEKVKLSALVKDGPVVLVVLRGFPGYQCPLCFRQVAELRAQAEEFVKLGAKVVLVYPGPGPAADLKRLASEFLQGVELPKPFTLMIDPEYSFTNLYELRWNAPRETSYPSTFVLDTKRAVKFRKISTSHGDRAPTKEVLAALAKIQEEAKAAAAGPTPAAGQAAPAAGARGAGGAGR
jgi:peroxiredoxin